MRHDDGRHNREIRQLEQLEASVAALRSILAHDSWANGDPITRGEREIVRYHLELMRAERDTARRELGIGYASPW